MGHKTTSERRIAALLTWFKQAGRPWPWRAKRDRWVILVAEVCLQQTQVTRAARHIERLLERYPAPEVMAAAPLADVLDLWHGLGYPRRARNLHACAQHIATSGWPSDYSLLPGVGPYTAAALRCFADEVAVLPPDINTRRVISRLFPEGEPRPDEHDILADHAWAWGQAVMELGQTSCRARAQCEACPVNELCPSAGTPEVIASPRQKPYAGSMRERRGRLLRTLRDAHEVQVDEDRPAAESLAEDGLAIQIERDGVDYLIPVR